MTDFTSLATATVTAAFEHQANGIALELLQYVPLADPIKISRLTLRNLSGRPRRLSVTAYAEWVLGQQRGASGPFIATRSIRPPVRCWPAIHGISVSPAVLLLPTLKAGRRHGRRTVPSFLAGMAGLVHQLRSSEGLPCPEQSGQDSIPALPCSALSSLQPARALKSCRSWENAARRQQPMRSSRNTGKPILMRSWQRSQTIGGPRSEPSKSKRRIARWTSC